MTVVGEKVNSASEKYDVKYLKWVSEEHGVSRVVWVQWLGDKNESSGEWGKWSVSNGRSEWRKWRDRCEWRTEMSERRKSSVFYSFTSLLFWNSETASDF